jgi:voltage-gated potassium channel
MAGASQERAARVQHAFELPVFVAALLVIPVLVLQESSVGRPWDTIAYALDWAIWLVFAVEIVVMLSVVPDPWQWLRDHPLELVVVIATPPILPATFQSIRALRLLRVLRLVRVAWLSRRFFSLDGLRYAALLTLLATLGGAAAFAGAEKKSEWDGLWWAVVTISTVGYGDLYPKTVTGRIVGICLIVIGVAFVAFLTAALAGRFFRREVRAVRGEIGAEDADATADVLGQLRAIKAQIEELEIRIAGQRERSGG